MNTEIIVILDESGSMDTLVTETCSGHNKFVEEQRAQPGKARYSLVKFNQASTIVFDSLELDKAKCELVPGKNYSPNGYTALLDAIGDTLTRHAERIKNEGWADQVIVAIITDGHENASQVFTHARIKELISHVEQFNWKVLYIGANQDAFDVGGNIGTRSFNVGNYQASRIGTHTMWQGVAAAASSYRADPNAVVNLNDLTNTK